MKGVHPRRKGLRAPLLLRKGRQGGGPGLGTCKLSGEVFEARRRPPGGGGRARPPEEAAQRREGGLGHQTPAQQVGGGKAQALLLKALGQGHGARHGGTNVRVVSAGNGET